MTVMARRWAVYLWALPTTALGALLVGAGLVTGARASVVGGVLEAHGGALDLMLRRLVPLRGGASAMTLGHVVVARDAGCLERTRRHERVHVRQGERWGPLFVPAYLVAALAVAARGGHYYRDHPFEREAMRVDTADMAHR